MIEIEKIPPAVPGAERRLFFTRVREALFGRVLLQPQVDGIEAILDYWRANYPGGDRRWLAYILATAHHETDRTMQPIEEYDKGGARLYAQRDPETGCAYYGRGFVQLTWRKNYRLAGDKLGIDLEHQPELACELGHAAAILVRGMVEGWFTGARLDWYLTDTKHDWYNARRIVNGLDRANLVTGYAKNYFEALG